MLSIWSGPNFVLWEWVNKMFTEFDGVGCEGLLA